MTYKLTWFNGGRICDSDSKAGEVVEYISPVTCRSIGASNISGISTRTGMVFKYSPGSIVANCSGTRPGQGATLVGENGVRGGSIGGKNSLPSIHLEEIQIIRIMMALAPVTQSNPPPPKKL